VRKEKDKAPAPRDAEFTCRAAQPAKIGEKGAVVFMKTRGGGIDVYRGRGEEEKKEMGERGTFSVLRPGQMEKRNKKKAVPPCSPTLTSQRGKERV